MRELIAFSVGVAMCLQEDFHVSGGMSGPQFQALPHPAPLPQLPKPAHHLQEMPVQAPEAAPGGEPQPRAMFKVSTLPDLALHPALRICNPT